MFYINTIIRNTIIKQDKQTNATTNKKNTIIKIIAFAQLLIASMSCVYFSSIEDIKLPDVGFVYTDKLLHMGAFIIYGMSLQVALIANMQKSSSKKIRFFILLIAAIFAASDEIHQSFVPGRSADILDWLADVVGVCISLLFYNLINNILNHKILKNINS